LVGYIHEFCVISQNVYRISLYIQDGDKSQSSSNSSNTLAENEIDCARDETQDMSKTPDEGN